MDTFLNFDVRFPRENHQVLKGFLELNSTETVVL